MKWITHQVVAAGGAMVLGLPVPAVAAAWAGAVLPDVLDHKRAALSRNPQRAFNRIHRRASHWFGWWAALFVLPLLPVFSRWPELAFTASGAGFGALTHIALDMVTPSGVPLLPPPFPQTSKARLSLNLCRTGSFGEYIFLAVVVVVYAFLLRERW